LFALGGWAAVAVAAGCRTASPVDDLARLPTAAAGDSALGRCPGSDAVYTQAQLADVMSKPARAAERVLNGVVPVAVDNHNRLVAIGSDHDLTSALHRTAYVTAVAIVDTAGAVVPGSVVITESDGYDLSHAVCTAMPHMQFTSARDGGRKVRALYREEFELYRTLDPGEPVVTAAWWR
jgi:CBS domain-containing protein